MCSTHGSRGGSPAETQREGRVTVDSMSVGRDHRGAEGQGSPPGVGDGAPPDSGRPTSGAPGRVDEKVCGKTGGDITGARLPSLKLRFETISDFSQGFPVFNYHNSRVSNPDR